jgi:hypothetical protein
MTEMKTNPLTHRNKLNPSGQSIYLANLQKLAEGGDKAAQKELQGKF